MAGKDVLFKLQALLNELAMLIDQRRSAGRYLSLSEVQARSLPVKLRDGAVRLFLPYL